jgi:hypothetical protein
METTLGYEAGGTAAYIDILQTACERLCQYFNIRAKIRRYIRALVSGFDLGMLSPTWYLMKSEIRLLVSTNLEGRGTRLSYFRGVIRIWC